MSTAMSLSIPRPGCRCVVLHTEIPWQTLKSHCSSHSLSVVLTCVAIFLRLACCPILDHLLGAPPGCNPQDDQSLKKGVSMES